MPHNYEDDPEYQKYMEEQHDEYEREMAHGGRAKCPHCHEYGIVRFTVNPQDPTSCQHCELCGMEEFFGEWHQGKAGPAPRGIDEPRYA